MMILMFYLNCRRRNPNVLIMNNNQLQLSWLSRHDQALPQIVDKIHFLSTNERTTISPEKFSKLLNINNNAARFINGYWMRTP